MMLSCIVQRSIWSDFLRRITSRDETLSSELNDIARGKKA